MKQFLITHCLQEPSYNRHHIITRPLVFQSENEIPCNWCMAINPIPQLHLCFLNFIGNESEKRRKTPGPGKVYSWKSDNISDAIILPITYYLIQCRRRISEIHTACIISCTRNIIRIVQPFYLLFCNSDGSIMGMTVKHDPSSVLAFVWRNKVVGQYYCFLV